ncbi:MAG: hypothetical protein IJZ15_05805 [Oscillospiraceae bacterium]|nr:hypothetical protein [Oscillospiraceae bacterium]
MKCGLHRILIFLIAALFLCGCSANPTQTSPATEPNTDTAKPLTELTDYELLCIMAEKKVVLDYAACSYMGEYPFTTLILISPEFAELMTRPTAADSLRTYAAQLEEEYPGSAMLFIEPYAPDMEAFINEATKSRTDLTDYELLRIMAEKEVCFDWKNFDFCGEYPFTTLTYISPEFTELLTRPTAADSLRANIGTLMDQYPDCALDALEPYIPEIEAYVNENVAK